MSGTDLRETLRTTADRLRKLVRPPDALERAFERAATIDAEWAHRGLVVFMVVVTVGLLVLTPQYKQITRLFPLMIGSLTTILLAVYVVALFSDSVRERVLIDASPMDVDADSAIDDDEQGDDVAADAPGEGTSTAEATESLSDRKKMLASVGWLLGLCLGFLLVGILDATLFFLFAYYAKETRVSTAKAAVYAIVGWFGILVVFDIVLGTPFFRGVFNLGFSEIVTSLLTD